MHFPAAWSALHLFPLLELVLPGIAVGEYAWDLDPPQCCHRRQAAVYACVVVGPEGKRKKTTYQAGKLSQAHHQEGFAKSAAHGAEALFRMEALKLLPPHTNGMELEG
ncbi:hypothetical protein C8J57DRAFT_1256796 [Mycena rebaudengoi]|nr:hypothetical protein C8J57DRAFT_1256796 [Mycena rebaudengoi]